MTLNEFRNNGCQPEDLLGLDGAFEYYPDAYFKGVFISHDGCLCLLGLDGQRSFVADMFDWAHPRRTRLPLGDVVTIQADIMALLALATS